MTPAVTQRIGVDGGDIVFERRGNGPPLVLLHGWSLDRHSFDRQVGPLSEQFTVLCIDRRGFGASSAPPDLAGELGDLDQLLDTLAIDRTHLLGVSQGGRIALRYALTRPARIESLVLQGAVVDGLPLNERDADRIPLEEYAALARAGRIEELRRRWLAHPLMQVASGDAESEAMLRAIVSGYEARDLLERSPRRDEAIDALQEVSGFDRPILVITGGRETAGRREHASRLAAAARHGTALEFPDSGHLPNLEESERFNRAVAGFCLGRTPRDASFD